MWPDKKNRTLSPLNTTNQEEEEDRYPDEEDPDQEDPDEEDDTDMIEDDDEEIQDPQYDPNGP